MKKITVLILVLSLMVNVFVFADDSVDKNDIYTRAESAGIIEDKNIDLRENVTREIFCEYVYNMLENVRELPVAKLPENPFSDEFNYKVNSLWFIGVISGKGDRIFAPNDMLTREEAAVIIYRAAKYLELDMPAVKVDMSYSDNDKISDWAISPIYSLRVLNILWSNEGEFGPAENVTNEQAIYSILKLYDIAKQS